MWTQSVPCTQCLVMDLKAGKFKFYRHNFQLKEMHCLKRGVLDQTKYLQFLAALKFQPLLLIITDVLSSLCDGLFPCFAYYSALHYHYFPFPVCGDVWRHGSWCADDLRCPLPGDPRESSPCPEE